MREGEVSATGPRLVGGATVGREDSAGRRTQRHGHGSRESDLVHEKSGVGTSLVSLAESSTGLSAGYAELRGEVAYLDTGLATASNKYDVPHSPTRMDPSPGRCPRIGRFVSGCGTASCGRFPRTGSVTLAP